VKSKDYRIIFLGTSEFAQVILKDIIELDFNVIACVTRPDRPNGRNLKLAYSPVKQYCLEHLSHIPIFQPEKVSTSEFQEILSSMQPDLFIVAAFGEIIKDNILKIPKDGSINVHPSLLPKYRGPSPLQTALLNGDHETGVCIIDVAQKMDAGLIFAMEKFSIDPDENFSSLQAKSLKIAKNLLATVIRKKMDKACPGEIQDDSKVTFCKKISSEDEKINWNDNLFDIHNKIRALSEKPGAWCYLELEHETKRVKIYSSSLSKDSIDAQPTNPKKHLTIKKDGYILYILSLQVEGKKRLLAQEFLTGVKTSFRFH
jgi:methionyl-tRNA formyltransferase